MAINPLLLNVKPISEITTVNNPTEGHLLFVPKQDQIENLVHCWRAAHEWGRALGLRRIL